MTLAERLDLTRCTPAQLWTALDPETKLAAARSLYAHDWGNAPTRREADAAIMIGMRFREAAVRQLPVDKRASYLARSIRPSDALAGSLVQAHHLEQRRPMLAAFLDALGIPHENGLIAESHTLETPAAAALRKAADALRTRFPAHEVEEYLACLYVLDRETWDGLAAILGGAPSAAVKR